MEKLKSLADLKRIREEAKVKLELRVRGDNPEGLVQVKVAMATCGIASGAKPIMDFFVDELDKRGIGAVVTQTGCMGYCYAEPTVEVIMPLPLSSIINVSLPVTVSSQRSTSTR